MHTITVDILNNKALDLLKKLEELNLLKVKTSLPEKGDKHKKPSSYKGIISKKTATKIQDHVKKSRSEWQ